MHNDRPTPPTYLQRVSPCGVAGHDIVRVRAHLPIVHLRSCRATFDAWRLQATVRP